MSSRIKLIVTEYTCDWCGLVEERTSDDAPYVTPKGWGRLHDVEIIGQPVAPNASDSLCPPCVAAYERALQHAKAMRCLMLGRAEPDSAEQCR